MKEKGAMEESKTRRLGPNGLWIPCSPGGTAAGTFGRPRGAPLSLLQEAKAIGRMTSALQSKGSVVYFSLRFGLRG